MTIFPVQAGELVERALSRIDEYSDTVKEQMVSAYLPQVVRVILTREPACRVIMNKQKAHLDLYASEIGQILWSHPGSMGGARIDRYLVNEGFSEKDSDTLAENILQYSRYAMAVVNHLRHIRSGITGIRDAIVLAQARDRYFSRSKLTKENEKDLSEQITELNQRKLSDEIDFEEWLCDVQIMIATLLDGDYRGRLANRNPNISVEKNLRNAGSWNMAMAYTRRFGRFVSQEFDIENLADRYTSKSSTILNELAELKLNLAGSDESVFERLAKDYDSRQARLKATIRPPASRASVNSSKDISHFEKLISSHLQMGDRELVVRNSSGKISPQLIEQMYKLFMTQLKIEPNIGKFVGKTIADGQVLEVELEAPTNRDASKLKGILETFFN